MKLKCINIVSTDPIRTKDFYTLVLRAPCTEIVPGRFEIPVGEQIIVITHTNRKTQVNPDCCGLEFTVENADGEYERLLAAGVLAEGAPVVYPWGAKAFAVKDPEGNNLDFVQFVDKAEAQ